MTLTEKMTKKLMEVVLQRGIALSLDVAGSFIPGWSVIKPILEKVLGVLPEEITGGLFSSEDNVINIIRAFEENESLLIPITQALKEQGITPEWTSNTLELVKRTSDDVIELLAKQDEQQRSLAGITALLEEAACKKGAHLELRAQRLEYIEHFLMPLNWLKGWDLAPGSALEGYVPGRHLPIGWMNWDFLMMNSGQQLAVIQKIELLVEEELSCPDEAIFSGVKPGFDRYEDLVICEPGQFSYLVFADKHLKYAPESDVDSFRIQIRFMHEQKIIQKLKLAIHWEDGTGNHATYGPSLFICSRQFA